MHVTWRTADELAAYLPREWHNRLRSGRGSPRIQPAFYLPFRGPHADAATPAAGGPAGCDPQTTGRDWLDRQGIAYAVLTSPDVPVISTWGDTDYPVALARAYNSWLIERWLSADRRFRGSLVVATQDPPAAAPRSTAPGPTPRWCRCC